MSLGGGDWVFLIISIFFFIIINIFHATIPEAQWFPILFFLRPLPFCWDNTLFIG